MVGGFGVDDDDDGGGNNGNDEDGRDVMGRYQFNLK